MKHLRLRFLTSESLSGVVLVACFVVCLHQGLSMLLSKISLQHLG